MKKLGLVLTTLTALATLAPAALADTVIYDSYPYDPITGSSVGGNDALYGIIGYQEVAVGFSPTQNYLLDSADLPFFYFYGGNGPITITAYSDSAGLPGAALDSATIPAIDTSAAAVYTVIFTAHPTLTAGQEYWIGAAAAGDTWDGWADMTSGAETTSYRTGSDLPWNSPAATFPALRVSGSPVPATPEPTSLMVVGIGAVSLLGLGLKRRLPQIADAR